MNPTLPFILLLSPCCFSRFYIIFIFRLSKVLQDLDGSKSREKLPKSELFSRTIQKNDNPPEPKPENQIKKETEIKHTAPEHLSGDNSEVLKKTDSNSKAKKKVKKEMHKSSESREQKFQRIKDTGNQFVKQVSRTALIVTNI